MTKWVAKEKCLPSKSRDQEIVNLARAGLAYEEIGKMYGISRKRISQICVREGFVRRPFDINPNNVSNKKAYVELLKDFMK